VWWLQWSVLEVKPRKGKLVLLLLLLLVVIATAFFLNAFGRCAVSGSSHWEAAGDSHDCPKRRPSITAVAAA
jgi:hypothetical protein